MKCLENYFAVPEAKQQHFIPDSILKNFCLNNNGRIYTYSKNLKKTWDSQTKNTAKMNCFYNFKTKDLSIELALGEIESMIASTFQKILNNQERLILTNDDIGSLINYYYIQMHRTPSSKALFSQYLKQDAKQSIQIIPEFCKLQNEHNNSIEIKFNESVIYDIWLTNIFQISDIRIKSFLNDFIITIMVNNENKLIINDKGYASYHAFQFFPISNNIILIFQNNKLLSNYVTDINSHDLTHLYRFGKASTYQVDWYNSLQVQQASQYIFAPSKELLEFYTNPLNSQDVFKDNYKQSAKNKV